MNGTFFGCRYETKTIIITEESEKEKFVNRFTPILVAVYHILLTKFVLRSWSHSID